MPNVAGSRQRATLRARRAIVLQDAAAIGDAAGISAAGTCCRFLRGGARWETGIAKLAEDTMSADAGLSGASALA